MSGRLTDFARRIGEIADEMAPNGVGFVLIVFDRADVEENTADASVSIASNAQEEHWHRVAASWTQLLQRSRH